MLKQIGYANFDGHPALRERVERLSPVIESEVGTAADRVSVSWTVRDGCEPPLVHLWMEDEWAGRRDRAFTVDELDETDFRPQVRRMHDDLLAQYLRSVVAGFQRHEFEQPVGG